MKKWKGDILFLLVIGALIGGWLYLYPRPADSPLQPIDPPEALDEENVRTYAAQEGLELAYRLYEPQGPVRHVVILLHDTLLHGGWYDALGCSLAAEGIAVYLPDRRGRGASAGDRRSVAEEPALLIEDITAMISVAQARFSQAGIYLGGHGRGAGLAVRYAATGRPIDGLIMISPYLSEDQPNLRTEGWQTLLAAHPGEAYLARSGLDHWTVWQVNWPQSMVEADPLIEQRISLSCMRETIPDDLEAAYVAVTMPLLCVQGEGDPLYETTKTSEWLTAFASPDRQLETLPGMGYLTVIEEAANPIAHWLEGR